MAEDFALVSTDTGEMTVGSEPQKASQTAYALAEIQGAMVLAKRFPRDYKECYGRLMMACKRKALAEKAEYRFPRGGSTVSGKTVVIARVAAQCYGNIRWGTDVIHDDTSTRTVRGWAWDIELNNKVSYDDTFKKVIQRKNKRTGETEWIVPDERDLRELTNRKGAICVRNSLLDILPRDYTDDSIDACRLTLASNITDPRAAAKNLIKAFGDMGVTVPMLNEYLESEQWTKDHIVDLTAVLNSINDGQAKIDEFFAVKTESKQSKSDKVAQDLVSKAQGIKEQLSPEETERQAVIADIYELLKNKKLAEHRDIFTESALKGMSLDALILQRDNLKDAAR